MSERLESATTRARLSGLQAHSRRQEIHSHLSSRQSYRYLDVGSVCLGHPMALSFVFIQRGCLQTCRATFRGSRHPRVAESFHLQAMPCRDSASTGRQRVSAHGRLVLSNRRYRKPRTLRQAPSALYDLKPDTISPETCQRRSSSPRDATPKWSGSRARHRAGNRIRARHCYRCAVR